VTEVFQANGLATLIGSLPLVDHEEALDLIWEHMPEIPMWAQLPANRGEGMMVQFASGLPGLRHSNDSLFVDTQSEAFERELLEFYEDFMALDEGSIRLDASRFTLAEDTARGFFAFLRRLQTAAGSPTAVKGQITGPFTFCTGIADQEKRAIFYEPQVRDAAVKLLALKACWQVERLAEFQRPVIIFVDEPGLAGFGSSEFTSITREDVAQCFEEVFEPVHQAGGLIGVHVCANTDWSLVLDSPADLVSFDAYGYFDRFILYPDQIRAFLGAGKFLAWGLVPTLNVDDLEKETTASLMRRFEDQIQQVAALGIDARQLIKQSLITPSCGAGTLSIDLAQKVLNVTREISREIRKSNFLA
jgi:methionine synthase II (cobalamin-independent)